MVQVANGPQISGCFWHSLTSIHKAPLGSKPWRHLHVRSVPHWALLVQSKSDLQPIQLRKKENIKYWNRNRKSWKSFLKSGLLFLRKKKKIAKDSCVYFWHVCLRIFTVHINYINLKNSFDSEINITKWKALYIKCWTT